MEKIAKNIIIVIGILLLVIVFILNLFCITKLGMDELASIELYSVLELFATLSILGVVVLLSKIISVLLDKTKKVWKIVFFISILMIYFTMQVVWINLRDAMPAWDQRYVYDIGVKMYNDETNYADEITYLESYPQQLSLATFYSTIFRIFKSTDIKLLQYINAISNVITVCGIFLISKQFETKYKANNKKSFLIILMFITLPILSTFVYGDIVSISLSILALYAIMKYSEKEKTIYAIISAVFLALACTVRMNSMICLIAIIIYMILEMFKLKTVKDVFIKIRVFILFIAISILPSIYIKTYWQEKLNLNKANKFPITGYVYMGMDNSCRGPGWYNDNHVSWTFDNIEIANEKYKKAIKERIKYFWTNKFECIKFYTSKTASMWCENTYAAVIYNHSYAFWNDEQTLEELEFSQKTDDWIYENILLISIFQKSIILIIFGTTIIALMKYRKNISNDVLLLVLVFIGGFLFHTIWESKSRYIIPYIIALIPITSIEVANYIKIKNYREK